MYKAHPEFELPPTDSVVWRYMEIEKFRSLISERALYFRRIDLLDDPFEGSLPNGNRGSQISQEYDSRGKMVDYYRTQGINVTREILNEMYGKPISGPSVLERFRRIHFVNCWHINEHESVAMWSLYLKTGKGIAIKTNMHNLINCLNTEIDIHIGKVKYVDYRIDKLPEHNVLNFLMSKQIQYQHENELRMLATYLPHNMVDHIPEGMYKPPQNGFRLVEQAGLLIDCELDKLFGEVILGPTSNGDLIDECESLLEKEGLSIPIQKSDLDDSPSF
jgi:hypothetical protein